MKTLRSVGNLNLNFEIQIERFKHPDKIYYLLLSICAPKKVLTTIYHQANSRQLR